MTDWQSIETAPKDGAEILGWRSDTGIMLIRWDCAESFMTDDEIEKGIEDGDWDEVSLGQADWFGADFISGIRLDSDLAPTHWMPLPEEPSTNRECAIKVEECDQGFRLRVSVGKRSFTLANISETAEDADWFRTNVIRHLRRAGTRISLEK